jgi:hypothetical protein
MQTERVTFLTSRDHKKALDSFASNRGESVGNVVREATSRFIAEPRDESEQEAELAALTFELEVTLPEMRKDFDAMLGSLRAMNDKIEAYRTEKALMRKAA